MVTTRRGGDLATSSHKNKRARNAGRETSEPLISGNMLGDSNQDVFKLPSNCHPEEPFGDMFGQGIWRGLRKKVSSNIQHNVVALASFHGETLFFACTGFAIKWNQSTTILTSATLVRSSGYENKVEENLRIEVYTNESRTQGTLQHYSLHYNVALVSVKDYCPRPAKIQLQYYMCSEVAAIGRCFKSGKLMAANGWLVDWTGTLDCKLLVRASCKISKVGIGGPLVNFDGEVIGMNFYDKRIGTPFLLWNDINKILSHFKDTVKGPVVEASNGSDPTGVPYWKMVGDRSDRPYRWPVRVPGRRRCDDLGDDEDVFDLSSGSVGRYTYRNGKRLLYRSGGRIVRRRKKLRQRRRIGPLTTITREEDS